MIIEIYKCDYCHNDIKNPKDLWELNDLFGKDACSTCANSYQFTLEEKLSDALYNFVYKNNKCKYSSSVIDTRCQHCGDKWAGGIEHISGKSDFETHLSLSFDLCKKCGDKVLKKFIKIGKQMLDSFRVKYKTDKDVIKLTHIDNLYQFRKF